MFHRLDRAVAKAIETTPAAVAIFDLSRVIGSLFGVGDGRVILRSAADAIGERRFRVPDQGGTRKIVALANTVEHLLKMHRTLHAWLHARIGQVRACRLSSTTFSKKKYHCAPQPSARQIHHCSTRPSARNGSGDSDTVGCLFDKQPVPISIMCHCIRCCSLRPSINNHLQTITIAHYDLQQEKNHDCSPRPPAINHHCSPRPSTRTSNHCSL